MIKQAVIVSIAPDGKTCTVSPLITGHCLSCKEGCAKRGTPFPVSNTKGFDLKTGDKVVIVSSGKAEALQSIVSLCFPVLTAILMYRLSFAFTASPSEGFKALCVLAGIVFSSALVLAISHFKIIPVKPEISEVI